MKLTLKQPHITEKAVDLSKYRKYVFIVELRASKSEIKKELKRKFNVDAVKVNVISIPGKKQRYGRVVKQAKGYRKAVVTLKEGQSLDLMPH
jgi:large subunit ribosomal protein L23